jgi:drug/metabolite transporter (DMT)-like permease
MKAKHSGLNPHAEKQRKIVPKGIILMVLAGLLYMLNNAAMKLVVEDIPLGEAIFLRGLFVCIPLLFVIGLRRRRSFSWTTAGPQSICAILSVLTVCLFVGSLPFLSLPVAVTISYSSPLFVILFAPLLLGERIDWTRGAVTVVGFIGVVTMALPSGASFSWVILMPLASALVMGLRDIAFRSFLINNDPLSILTSSQVAVTMVGLALALFAWSPPTITHVLLLFAAAACFGVGVYFAIEAFRYGEASTIAGFRYSGMLWAVLVSFLIWGDLPSGTQIVGTLLVAGAGSVAVVWEGGRKEAAVPLGGGADADPSPTLQHRLRR